MAESEVAFWARLLGQPPRRGWRHYLKDEPVHAGDQLELWLDEGWYRVRYEWTYRADEPPALYCASDKALTHRPEMLLCWPNRS